MWTERLSGKTHQRGQLDHRSPFEHDKTRVIHCPSFRRLQRKTQILGTEEGDFHRTRLTHSLEVASIGVNILRHLQHQSLTPEVAAILPPDDLISVICLLHDMGHPPFGHGGEVALNYKMRDHGGFEGNGQTLRLLTKTESSYGTFGLDLTRRTLLGILKYPVTRSQVVATALPVHDASKHQTIRVNDWLPPKAYFETEQAEVEWLLAPVMAQERQQFQSLACLPTGMQHGKTRYQSLDCSLMNIADDIAYGVHDLEDAIYLRLIHRDRLDIAQFQAYLNQTSLAQPIPLIDNLFHSDMYRRKEAIGELVNYFVTHVHLQIIEPAFETPLLKYNAVLESAAADLLQWLVETVYRHVIDSQAARMAEFGGQTVVLHLFDALSSNPVHLLNHSDRVHYQAATDEAAAYRVVCDYIAGMTDDYAYRLYERLFALRP